MLLYLLMQIYCYCERTLSLANQRRVYLLHTVGQLWSHIKPANRALAEWQVSKVTTLRATGCIFIVYWLCLLFAILSAVNVITFTIILSCCDAVLDFA